MQDHVRVDDEPVIVLTTWPSSNPNASEKFLKPLLQENLIACANILGEMQSMYVWKGELCFDNERQIILKTTRKCVDKLQARFKDLHPFECPEFLVLGASASMSYGEFLIKSTGARK